jgi:hypothetical protein
MMQSKKEQISDQLKGVYDATRLTKNVCKIFRGIIHLAVKRDESINRKIISKAEINYCMIQCDQIFSAVITKMLFKFY